MVICCPMKSYLTFLPNLLLALCLPINASAEEEATAIAHHGFWSVFNDGVACWVVTLGWNNTSDAKMAMETTRAYAAFHNGNVEPMISFELGAMTRDDMTVTVGGSQFELFEHQQSLFTYEEDLQLLRQMLKNGSMKLGDDAHNVVFSLYGFQDAYNHVAKICDFRSLDLDDSTEALRQG